MATKRVLKELNDIQNINPLTFCSVGTVDQNIYHWRAAIMGSPDSPYAGGVFIVDINISKHYPFVPPEVAFKTKIFHPNIDSYGYIYLAILVEEWNAGFTISEVLLAIHSLLMHPNLDEPMEREIANMYKTDKANYDATAKSWTLKYAMG